MKLIENYTITKKQFNNRHNKNIYNFYNIRQNISRKLTIGLLINSFYNKYEFEIWEGLNQAVSKYGHKLISFVGASINNPYFNNNQKNKIYELPDIKNIDGLLILSSSIGSYINHKEMENFISSFHPIPRVSIGTIIKDIPSVVINNKNGFYDLMVHLIKEHKYKKIAFIQGPKKNKDAKERFETYKKVLNQYNIKIDPDLIIEGSFHPDIGKKAVSILIDERKKTFDVLIGSNDYVAMNAVKELKRREIDVPNEIAVVGFDNISDSKNVEKSLTTVNQPTYDLGYEAGLKILSILNGKKVSLTQELNSQIVIRKSCGCIIQSKKHKYNDICSNNIKHSIIKKGKNQIEYFISLIVYAMQIEFDKIINKSELSKWAEILLASIISDLENKSSNIFLIKFKKIIANPKLSKINKASWDSIMNFIFKEILPRINNLKDNIKYNELFKDVIKTIHYFELKHIEKSMTLTNELTMILSFFIKKIQKVDNAENLKSVILNFLPLVGIKSLYISIFYNQKHLNEKSNYFKIFYTYKNYGDSNKQCEAYNLEKLIPEIIKDNYTDDIFITFPLIYNNENFGFIIYEIEKEKINPHSLMGTHLVNIYEEIVSEIGDKIKEIMSYKKYPEENQKNIISESSSKYKNIHLNKKILEKYYQKIILYMEKEKPYLNIDLTLPELAWELEISRNKLSYVLNKYFKQKFYDFINEYRVKEAQALLKKNSEINLNLLEIAYDSGFKSKTTFNKMFKNYTNMTPSEYRNIYLKKN